MTNNYKESQIKAAKENASLLGFTDFISDNTAIAFLDWYLTSKGGLIEQRQWWEDHLLKNGRT